MIRIYASKDNVEEVHEFRNLGSQITTDGNSLRISEIEQRKEQNF